MSYVEASEAGCSGGRGSVELLIKPRMADLGEFSVRRALPASERRTVGPFVFFDHFGPVEFPPGKSINVRPHPHIGIATITYLFEGEILHRDSLGVVQPIQAGAVNLMTAGRGIVHSERPGRDVDVTSHLHGIQSWIALPNDQEEREPEFIHYPHTELPRIPLGECRVTVIMGSAFGATSPVKTYSPTLYLDCHMPAGAVLTLPADQPELALYVAAGAIELDAESHQTGVMAVACPRQPLELRAREESRVMVIGGASVGERFLSWNFVSSSKARIEQARQDWLHHRFDAVPGDDEFIPLPQ